MNSSNKQADYEEIIQALNTIKEYCATVDCEHCGLAVDRYSCGLYKRTPVEYGSVIQDLERK